MRRALRWLVRYGLAGPDYDAPGLWPDVRRLLAFFGLCAVVVAAVALTAAVYTVLLVGGRP